MESAPSRPTPVWLLLLGALGAIIGFAWSEQDYIAASALAVMALAGLWGYCVGALRLLGLFGGLTLAYTLADPLGQELSPRLTQDIGLPPGAAETLRVILSGAMILVVVSIAMAIASRRILQDRPQLQATNRLLGFGVGGLQGALAMLLLLNGLLVVEPYAQQRLRSSARGEENPLARAVALRVVDVAERTRRSSIAELVKTYNPFQKLPQLRQLQRAVVLVSQSSPPRPVPSRPIRSAQRPKSEVRLAIESLARDPQLRRIAESKQPLDPQTAVSLLNHPGIAKLLEQPDLMQQLYEAMDDLGLEPAPAAFPVNH